MTEAQVEEILRRILASTEHNGERRSKSTMAIVTSILIAIAPTLAAAAAWFKADSTHKLVNSRMTELLELTRIKGQAEGRGASPMGQPSAGDAELAVELMKVLERYKQK